MCFLSQMSSFHRKRIKRGIVKLSVCTLLLLSESDRPLPSWNERVENQQALLRAKVPITKI